MGNGGVYKGCTSPIKVVSEIHFNFSSRWNKDKIIQKITLGEQTCDGRHMIYTSYLMLSLKKRDLRKVASESKHLSEEDRAMLHNVLIK